MAITRFGVDGVLVCAISVVVIAFITAQFNSRENPEITREVGRAMQRQQFLTAAVKNMTTQVARLLEQLTNVQGFQADAMTLKERKREAAEAAKKEIVETVNEYFKSRIAEIHAKTDEAKKELLKLIRKEKQ